MGMWALGRWQKLLFDSAYTIGAVAVASLVHFALGLQFAERTLFLVYMLAVVISAARGGLYQGIFATLLTLTLGLMLWGEWNWLLPMTEPVQFIEIVSYVVVGLVISLLAEFSLNGRLALRHSHERFQVLFDSMPAGAFIHTQGKIVAANRPLAEMFGTTQHELVGVTPLSMIAPESHAEITRRIQTQSEELYRATGLRRDGSTFPLEVIGKNIDYQGQRMRIIVARDMTDHLIARQRLEQMNELLEARVAERTTALNATVADLRTALDNVRMLSGLLPICGSCKRIRDDDGYWSQVEDYISAHSEAEFSHSLCPECLAKLRDDIAERHRRQGNL